MFKGQSRNGAIINGNAEFLDGSQNTTGGQITGSAIFKNSSKNRGIVKGDATFLDLAVSAGRVDGFSTFEPPLLATWELIRSVESMPRQERRINVAVEDNGGRIEQTLRGPIQTCPSQGDGCYTLPQNYRLLVKFSYVLDYARHPEYVRE